MHTVIIVTSLLGYQNISTRSFNYFVLKKDFIDLFNVLFISSESIRSTDNLVGMLFSSPTRPLLPLPEGKAGEKNIKAY